MTDTEIEITADLVRDLLREQHPDLADLGIREVVGGWGNQLPGGMPAWGPAGRAALDRVLRG
ncbi:hypothetical protein AB0N20_20635 [Streptomyces griseoincarnatus]